MTLKINLLGEKVQAFCNEEPIDLGNDDFVLGLLTPWYEIKGEARKFSVAEITRMTATKKQLTSLHDMNDPQSRVRHAKKRLQICLAKACGLFSGMGIEEILELAQVDVVLFRQALKSATQEPLKTLDPVAVENALNLYGGRLFDGYTIYDYESEAKIEEMQRYYDDLFCRGIKILLQKQSPRLHRVVVSKSIQIQKSECLKASAPQLLKNYNRLLVKNADRIPLDSDEIGSESEKRLEPKTRGGTFESQASETSLSYEGTPHIPDALTAINPLTLPAEFPFLTSSNHPVPPNNLPQQVTSFVGREKEMTEVPLLLDRTRLLSLTGSGGCGKTRLALQVAAQVKKHYSDGVWLVELASLADPVLVPQTVAEALRIMETPGQLLVQTLVESLKSRRLLLVLDNCEHLLDACAQLADTLIHSCPNITILASSREVLGISGETVYRVPSLSRPGLRQIATPASLNAYEAARLFVDRATSASSAFVVTNANAPALASLCHRLDGIPFALELAAARIHTLSVEQINDRLDDSFRLLTSGSRTALPKHKTLRALIDWSYELLDSQERTLLSRLSVFADGWTLEGAEQVCSGETITRAEVLDLLTALVNKSLVVAEDEDGAKRYHLQETMRQYAAEKLRQHGETEQIKRRHRDWCLALVEANGLQSANTDQEQCLPAKDENEKTAHRQQETMNAYMVREQYESDETKPIASSRQLQSSGDNAASAPQLLVSDPVYWLQRLEREYKGLRAALKWNFEEGEVEVSLNFCKALQVFWTTRGYVTEGREWCRRVLTKAGAEARMPVRAVRLWGAAAALRDAMIAPRQSGNREEYASDIAVARSVLGEAAFTTAWMEGQAMTLEQAIAYALNLSGEAETSF